MKEEQVAVKLLKKDSSSEMIQEMSLMGYISSIVN
jgi:hypothetical protein